MDPIPGVLCDPVFFRLGLLQRFHHASAINDGAATRDRAQWAQDGVSGANCPTQDAVEPASPGHSHRPLGGDAAGGAGGYLVLNPSKQVLSTISMIWASVYRPEPLRKPSTGSQALA